MKKKWLALSLAGILCLNLTGCNSDEKSKESKSDYSAEDALAEYKKEKEKGKEKSDKDDEKESANENDKDDNKADEDNNNSNDNNSNSEAYLNNGTNTKGYTEITMFNAKFMVPDKIAESGQGVDGIVRFYDEPNTYDVKARYCEESMRGDEIEDIAKNIEDYYLEYFETVVEIDADDCIEYYNGTMQKYIFPSVTFNDSEAAIAYLSNVNKDTLLYIVDKDDVFTDKETDIMLKSFEEYTGNEYTYVMEFDTELVELTPVDELSVDEAEEKQQQDEEEATAFDEKSENPLYAFEMTINGDTLKLPMWFTDLEEAGWKYDGDRDEMVPANSRNVVEYWKKGDAQICTTIINFGVNAVPFSECIVTEIAYTSYKEDDKNVIELPAGIKLNKSNCDEVLKAYGEADDTYEGNYSIKLSYEPDDEHNVELLFDIETKILNSVEIECQEILEGVDNEIKDERPEILDTYKEPSKLSKDLLDTTVELDGVVYQLPCPMEKLLEDGWTIKAKDDTIVSPLSKEYCRIVKDDLEVMVWLKNPVQDAIYAKYSYVVGFDISIYDGSAFPMTIGNGITIGDTMTPDEIIAKFEGMEVNALLDDEKIKHIFVKCTDDIEYNIFTQNGIVGGISVDNDVSFKR